MLSIKNTVIGHLQTVHLGPVMLKTVLLHIQTVHLGAVMLKTVLLPLLCPSYCKLGEWPGNYRLW